MDNVKVPDFLKNFDRDAEPREYAKWLMRYADKFGDTPATEGIVRTEEEFIEIFKGCIETGKEIDDYLGLGEIGPDDEI